MIGLLRKHNTTASAIDQPIDFEIPESTVMLAVYLAVPEAENSRRSLNTTNGIRRAKQMGRYPNKAPLGYLNLTAPDGKKYIGINLTEASLIKWSFQQLAKNAYRIEQVRRMVNAKGLVVSKSRFWILIHNPVYCGYVSFLSKETNKRQLIKGIHQPIISEALFYEVQSIISTNRKIISKAYELNDMFTLRKYLICPACGRKLTGSYSQGKCKRYPYYHCVTGCKARFHANIVNNDYENKLDQLVLLPSVLKLFDLVLEDVNVNTQRDEQLHEQRKLLKQIEEQEYLISKARKLFTLDKIQFDDFSSLKKEYQVASSDLKDELNKVMVKLSLINKQLQTRSFDNIFSRFSSLHVNDKKHIVELISPTKFDVDGNFTLKVNTALSNILSFRTDLTNNPA
jgi:site-specific DNA recombinase